jgi:flagellar biosynthesis protein FlhB
MKRKGVGTYDAQIESYTRSDANELDGLSALLKQEAEKQNIPVEKKMDTLKEQVGNDLRKNIPPQLYAVVSGIVDVIGKLEEDELDEG